MKKHADLNNNKIEFYAHLKPGKEKQEWQPFIEHLKNTETDEGLWCGKIKPIIKGR